MTWIRWWEALRAPEVKWQKKYRAEWDAPEWSKRRSSTNSMGNIDGYGRFNGDAKEEDQGESALVLDLAKASDAGQSPCGLGLATHFPRKDLASAVLVFRAPGCAAEPLTTITAILPGFKWSCLLLRCVLQDALSEVTKFLPSTEVEGFC